MNDIEYPMKRRFTWFLFDTDEGHRSGFDYIACGDGPIRFCHDMRWEEIPFGCLGPRHADSHLDWSKDWRYFESRVKPNYHMHVNVSEWSRGKEPEAEIKELEDAKALASCWMSDCTATPPAEVRAGKCATCGFVMCEQFDERPVTPLASICTPNGKFWCYHCKTTQGSGSKTAEVREAELEARIRKLEAERDLAASGWASTDRALAQVEAERAWRPISTAPRDGTWILAWRKEFDYPQIGRFVGIAGKNWKLANRLEFWDTEPTHWQPLPPGPQAQTEVQ